MSRRQFIEFHSHFFAPDEVLAGRVQENPGWARIWRLLQDEAALLADIESGDIDGRVLNSPAALLTGDGVADPDLIRRLNDSLARVISRHPGRLTGLAGVDIFQGETAAREIERAVRELGFRGVFADSARGTRLADAPEARPAFLAAAELGVPVFLHPVYPPGLSEQLAPYGRPGVLLARGTVNAAAVIALIHSGLFEEAPALDLVVTTLALGGLAVASGLDPDIGIAADSPGGRRARLHVDTMGLDPGLIRLAVGLLGAEHVLLGTDWPIVNDAPLRARAERAFAGAGLSAAEADAIAAGNARRLLGLGGP